MLRRRTSVPAGRGVLSGTKSAILRKAGEEIFKKPLFLWGFAIQPRVPQKNAICLTAPPCAGEIQEADRKKLGYWIIAMCSLIIDRTMFTGFGGIDRRRMKIPTHILIFATACALLGANQVCRAQSTKQAATQTNHPFAKFFSLDSNSDGELTAAEFVAEGSLPENRLRRDFKLFDVDHNGRITTTEFQAIPNWVPEDHRTGLPDPVVLLSEAAMSELSKLWTRCDGKQHDGLLSRSELSNADLGQQVQGLQTTQFIDWDLNGDGQISREEASQILDIAFGVRNPEGGLLRSKTGYVVDWRMYRQLKTDANGMVSRNEYFQSLGPLDIREKQKWLDSVDHNRDGLISFEEFSTSPHRTDPLQVFLELDADLNGRLTQDELDGLPQIDFPSRNICFLDSTTIATGPCRYVNFN